MPKKTKKRTVKPSITKLKKELWKWFSLYVRTRDKYRCFTCDRYAKGSGLHAGHFISNSTGGLGLRYEETNVHAQCLTSKSNILRLNGVYAPISDIKVGDMLDAFAETGFQRSPAIVVSVKKFLPDELYEIELEDGRCFESTGDHRVVSNGRWVEVKEMLHNISAHDILEL